MRAKTSMTLGVYGGAHGLLTWGVQSSAVRVRAGVRIGVRVRARAIRLGPGVLSWGVERLSSAVGVVGEQSVEEHTEQSRAEQT